MQTQKSLRQRKLLLVLPLILLPFITLLFIALGGGQQADGQIPQTQRGFNTKLPDAKLKDERSLNKMSYYDQAALDSQKRKEAMKTDPYYQGKAISDTTGAHFASAGPDKINSSLPPGAEPGKNEVLVKRKLAELQTAINRPPAETRTESPNPALEKTTNVPMQAAPIEAKEDPELRQMNGLLEKILDIQHPERLKEKADPALSADTKKFKAIPAEIDGTQKITQGTVVRLKLLDTISLNGQLIPKGQLVFASGNLYNQRLTLNIKNIRVGYTILPVDLTVFDMNDGLEGINVPEAITGDALKDGAAGGVQGVEFMSLDPSLTTQLAGAGLNTAKGLFSKKVKRVKAKLKDRHPLLLRNNKSIAISH